VVGPQSAGNGVVAIDPRATRSGVAWDHSLAGTNDNMSRFGLMPSCGGVRRSTESDQEAQCQASTHCIANSGVPNNRTVFLGPHLGERLGFAFGLCVRAIVPYLMTSISVSYLQITRQIRIRSRVTQPSPKVFGKIDVEREAVVANSSQSEIGFVRQAAVSIVAIRAKSKPKCSR
jgi:hypothetical protein